MATEVTITFPEPNNPDVVIEFPDGMSEQQIEDILRKKFLPNQARSAYMPEDYEPPERPFLPRAKEGISDIYDTATEKAGAVADFFLPPSAPPAMPMPAAPEPLPSGIGGTIKQFFQDLIPERPPFTPPTVGPAPDVTPTPPLPQFPPASTKPEVRIGPTRPLPNERDAFTAWYAHMAHTFGLDPNPFDPRHQYDYVRAWRAGVTPDESGHWPSEFKLSKHSNRIIGGIDTITGEPVAPKQPPFAPPTVAPSQTVAPTPQLPQQPGIAEVLESFGSDLGRTIITQGALSAAALNRGLETFSQNVDKIAEWISGVTGLPKGNVFAVAKDVYGENAEYWESKARDPNLIDKIVGEFVGGVIPGVAEFMLNVPYAGLVGMAHGGPKEAAMQAAERALWIPIFRALHFGSRALKAGALGAGAGAQAGLSGASPEQIAESAGVMALIGGTMPSGPVSTGQAIREAIRPTKPFQRPRREPYFGVPPEETERGFVFEQAKEGPAFTAFGEPYFSGEPAEQRREFRDTRITPPFEPRPKPDGSTDMMEQVPAEMSSLPNWYPRGLGVRHQAPRPRRAPAKETPEVEKPYGLVRPLSSKMAEKLLDIPPEERPAGAEFLRPPEPIKRPTEMVPKTPIVPEPIPTPAPETVSPERLVPLPVSGPERRPEVAPEPTEVPPAVKKPIKTVERTVEPKAEVPAKNVAQRVVQSGRKYLGQCDSKTDCQVFLGKAFGDAGIDYKKAVDDLYTKGGKTNKYITGEGLTDLLANPDTVTDVMVKSKDTKQFKKAWSKLVPGLKEGNILSFSTTKSGHTGIVTKNSEGKWMYLNAQRSRVKGKDQYTVVEESLEGQVKEWMQKADKQGSFLTMKTGAISEQAARQYATGPDVMPVAGMGTRRTTAPGMPTAKKGKIKAKPSAIIDYIDKNLMPMRTGIRRRKRDVLGIFKRIPFVGRTRKANDVEVAMHEVAHGIEQTLGLPKTMPSEVRKLASMGDADREGFAEFLRLYVTDFTKAQSEAPNFYRQFESTLNKNPKLRDHLHNVRDAWEEWYAKPGHEKVEEFIVSYSDAPKPEKLSSEFYRQWVDDLNPQKAATRRMEEISGEPVRPSLDPFKLSHTYAGTPRRVLFYLEENTYQYDTEKGVVITGPGLKQRIANIKPKNKKKFDAYLLARRALNNPKVLAGFEGILSRADFEATYNKYNVQFRSTADSVTSFAKELLTYLKNSGRISEEAHKRILESELYYAPLARLIEVDPSYGKATRKVFGNLTTPLFRLKGSARDVYSPIETLIQNTYVMMNLAEQARVGQAFVEMAKTPGMGEIIEQRPFTVKPFYVTKGEIETILRKYGEWTEKVTHQEIENNLGKKITELGGDIKEPTQKVLKIAMEALQHRGWTEAEARQILGRLKESDVKERTTIIEQIIEKKALTQIEREFGVDITDPSVAVWRQNYKPGPTEVIFYDKGEPKLYHIQDAGLRESVLNLRPEAMNFITKILSKPASWLRAGATMVPEFSVARNPTRDVLMSYWQSDYLRPWEELGGPFVIGLQTGYNFFNILGKGDAYKKFIMSGGAHGNLVSSDRDLTRKAKDLMRKSKYRYSKLLNPAHILEDARILSEVMENAPRLSEFQRARAKLGAGIRAGKTLKQGAKTGLDVLVEAAYAAREVTVPFSRAGVKGKAIKPYIAFWGARTQGIDKVARTFKNHPVRSTFRALYTITLPSILLWLKNKDDPVIQETPKPIRDLFWLDVVRDDKGNVLFINRYPKPHELGIFFGSIIESALDAAYRDDPEGITQSVESLLKSLNVVQWPTAVGPFVDVAQNRDWLYRPVVPEERRQLSPERQYGPWTSETVKKAVGAIMKIPHVKDFVEEHPSMVPHITPAGVEEQFLGWFAGVGRYMLDTSDYIMHLARFIDLPPEPHTPIMTRIPGIRGFTFNWPRGSTVSTEQFYKEINKIETRWLDILDELKVKSNHKFEILNQISGGQFTGAFGKAIEKYPELQKAVGFRYAGEYNRLKELKQIQKTMTLARDAILAYREDPDMSPKDKATEIRKQQNLIIDLARMALGKSPIKRPNILGPQSKE